MGTVNLLEAVRALRCGPRSARRRQRHQRQVLREPRDGPRLPRGRRRWAATTRTARARAAPSSSPPPTGAASSRRRARRGVATARAGNVIGGGDWGEDRIVPDCVRALAPAQPIAVRNPDAVRPWQHVLEPLSGYLWLGAACGVGRRGARRHAFDGAWNFGPAAEAQRDGRARSWRRSSTRGARASGGRRRRPREQPHEAGLLVLDAQQGASASSAGGRSWSVDEAVASPRPTGTGRSTTERDRARRSLRALSRRHRRATARPRRALAGAWRRGGGPPRERCRRSDAAARARSSRWCAEYYDATWGEPAPFVPGQSRVPYGGRVFDAERARPARRRVARLLAHLRPLLGALRARVSPGTSASSTACSSTRARRRTCWPSWRSPPSQLGERRIERGDEVITVAAGFPDHGRADRPVRRGAGLRRRALPTRPTSTSRSSRRRSRPAHQGGHARPHARQPVRRRGRARRSASGTACG